MQSFKLFIRFILICLTLLGMSVSLANAATLNVDGSGNLLGASGVNVIGFGLYDVVFAEGTCAALFDGCNEASDFDFTSPQGAEAASNALLADVFVDGGSGQFDSIPELTFGCGPAAVNECVPITPWGISSADFVAVAVAYNKRGDIVDFILTGGIDENTDYGSIDNANFALWTPSAMSAVPVPAAVWLFGTALIGFVGMSRRRKVA